MLRDFLSIADFFNDREIDELQAAIDTRREARERSSAPPPSEPGPSAWRAGRAEPKPA